MQNSKHDQDFTKTDAFLKSEAQFDMGSLGLLLLKIEAKLNVLYSNQARLMAYTFGGNQEQYTDLMIDGEQQFLIKGFEEFKEFSKERKANNEKEDN